jgi:hypothetical protein
MSAVSDASATSSVVSTHFEDTSTQKGDAKKKADTKSDKQVAQLAKDATKFTKEVHRAASGIGKAVASAKKPKGLAGFAVDNIENDIEDLGIGGKGAAKRIWSLLLSVFSMTALEVGNVIAEEVPAAVPVVAGIGVGLAGLSVALSIDSVVRAGRVSRMLQGIRDSVDKVSTEEEKKAALLEGLKKLKSEDLDSLQERLMFSKSADLAKRVDTAISKLEKPVSSGEAVKEVEKMTKTLSFRAKLALGLRLLGLAFRVMIAAGMALLSYGPDPVSKLSGAILLGLGIGLSFILFLGKFLFVNPNPFDPESKTRAQIVGESIRKSGVSLLRKLHIIRDQPATQEAGQAATK